MRVLSGYSDLPTLAPTFRRDDGAVGGCREHAVGRHTSVAAGHIPSPEKTGSPAITDHRMRKTFRRSFFWAVGIRHRFSRLFAKSPFMTSPKFRSGLSSHALP